MHLYLVMTKIKRYFEALILLAIVNSIVSVTPSTLNHENLTKCPLLTDVINKLLRKIWTGNFPDNSLSTNIHIYN